MNLVGRILLMKTFTTDEVVDQAFCHESSLEIMKLIVIVSP